MNGEPVTGATGDIRLVRVRIIVIAVGFALVGAASGDIFDRSEWVLVVAPLPAAVVAFALVARPWIWRLAGAASALVLAVVSTVTVTGGTLDDVTAAFTSGFQGLLSTDWPSPRRADLLGTVAAGLAATCAASSELATRRRFHLLGLLPLLLAYLGVVALSAPLGVTWSWLVGLAVVSIVFSLLRNDGTLSERLVLLRGERRLAGLLAGGLAVIVLVALALSLGVRADPRRNDPAQQTASLLDPIEATAALRTLDPPIDLHVVTATGDDVLPARWRTAALTSYDGQRWSPRLTLRPIGFTLGPAREPTIEADVSFLSDNLNLVPLPGPPVAVDTAVETDADRTVVRLATRPAPGDIVGVVANAPTPSSDALALGVRPRLVDETISGLTQLAEGLAGSGNELDRLRQLEATMRDEFVLDSNVQGGGLEQALIDRFLRDTQRGTAEQFATSFVLLARSLGVEARIATGFIADADAGSPGSAPGDQLVLTSADASVWPEVQLTDGSWVAYDPVPEEESSDEVPPPPEPQVQAPAAPQPPVAPPPESDTESDDDDELVDTSTDSALSTLLTWVLGGSIAVAVVFLPMLIAAGMIVGVKYRRRSRRLRAPDPNDRIRGAWASATDALVDAGLDIDTSTTDFEIAAIGTPLVADASTQLRRLASMSSAATFGSPRHPDVLAEDASSCLNSVEQAVVSMRTRWQRLRWRLSLRSLRPATRSPVTD
jgi:hypothetical protein